MDVAATPAPAPRIVQTILWRRLDLPGHDACALWKADAGWRLSGTAVFVFEGRPCHLAYVVQCDAAEAPAAWLSFPELALVRLAQHYRRVGADQYAYRAPDVGYTGILVVSDAGLVTTYPGLWEVEALQ